MPTRSVRNDFTQDIPFCFFEPKEASRPSYFKLDFQFKLKREVQFEVIRFFVVEKEELSVHH